MSEAVKKILDEVKSLTLAERDELSELLRATHLKRIGNEKLFEEMLAAEGWLTLPEPVSNKDVVPPLPEPIQVKGLPLSEVLIQERR